MNSGWESAKKKLYFKHRIGIQIELFSTFRNLPDDILRRKIYCQKMKILFEKAANVFFIDEMAINQWTVKDKIWAQKDKSYANTMLYLKKEGLLLVAVMNNKSSVKYEVFHGTSPKSYYSCILNNLFDKSLEKYNSFNNILVIHSSVGN